jgi:Flp pilus assembly pilin Flp
MSDPIGIKAILSKLVECVRDEKGVAMTEYLLVTAIMVPVGAYLFHPDNGLYQDMRAQYDMTTTMLRFFGP